MHLAALIRELGEILAIAAPVSLLFHRIRQPVVLGYICAGIVAAAVAGPFTSEIRTIADLGVIFLMFSLGLEFSFRKVVRLGPTVAFAALFEVAGLFVLGFWIGRLLGWSPRDSLFLGGMVSISSTTIIVKAFEELGLKHRRFAQIVLGMLIFEDLLAILMLVAFSGLAASGQISPAALVSSFGTMILFVGGWFLAGTFLLPRFFRRMSAAESDEMLMIVSVALCLLLGVAASKLGYSAGLGAFLMGSILAESSESHRIENLVRPLRDLFVAIFFVSVGMLVDPQALLAHWREVVLLTLLVLVGKFAFVSLGSLLAGRPLKTAVLVGGSMVQIGELSFVMAGLGISMRTMDPAVQPTIVAVSVLTTLATPFAIRRSPQLAGFLERLLPGWLRVRLEGYSRWSERRAASAQPDPALRAAVLRWSLAGFVVTLVGRISLQVFSEPWFGVVVGVTLLPFLWTFLRGLRLETESNARSRHLVWNFMSQAAALLVSSVLAWPYFSGTPFIWFLAVAGAVLLVRFFSGIGRIFEWFESSFRATLQAGESKSETGSQSLMKKLAPWEGELVRLKVHPDSEVAGLSIQDAALRNRIGLNIVAIQRGARLLVAPSPTQQIFPKDEVLVLGLEEQVEKGRRVIELGSARPPSEEQASIEAYQLRAIDVTESSACAGKTLRESGIRDRYSALVVGLERAGKRIMNPDSSLRVMPGDTLWIVGETNRIGELAAEMSAAPVAVLKG